jgi:hypothetical protein
MSGWIKLEKDLLTDPRLVAAAMELEARFQLHEILGGVHSNSGNALAEFGDVTPLPSTTLLVGGLARLWMIADTHIGEDDILALNAHQIDKLIGIEGFCQILPDEWLQILDGNRVKLPNYHSHNGTTAKERASNAERQSRYRQRVTAKRNGHIERSNAVTLPDLDLDKTQNPTMVAKRPRTQNTYPPEFEEIRRAYPRRAGSNPWPRALKAIHARLAEGATWAELADGVRRYAEFVRATRKEGTELVQQAARFFGPGKEFENDWKQPAQAAVQGGWQ